MNLAEYPPESENGDEPSLQPEHPDTAMEPAVAPMTAGPEATKVETAPTEQPGANEVAND
jgi:hypothetical protein